MPFSYLRNSLASSATAVTIVQVARVAPTVRPAGRFVVGVVRDAPAQRFHSRRLGHDVHLRPRGDLLVAGELISQNVYSLPKPVQEVLSSVPGALRVLDLGANIGLFGVNLKEMFASPLSLVAVEPDPSNLPLLRANLDAAGLDAEVVEAAAGVDAGTIRFAAGQTSVSRTMEDDELAANEISVPVIDIFPLAVGADLIKMDIEGSEWPILLDPRLKELTARAVVMESHQRGSPSGDSAKDATDLLRAAGYEVAVSPEPRANEIWAWRKN